MINFYNIVHFTNSSKKEFKPYYEKENDFNRLALLYGIAGMIISPIFCFLIYQTAVPVIYFQIGLSFTLLFPVYIALSYFIQWLNNKLIYFFVVHFFIVTYLAFISNLDSNFELIHTFCFYALFTVILFVLQRLYPAILYNFFVLSLLIYAYNQVKNPDIPVLGTMGIFSVISLCSVLVLVSRKRLITSVEDYSEYLSTIVNNPGIGYVLLKFSSTKEQVIDFNNESYRLLNCKKEQLPAILFAHFSKEEQQQMFNLKIGNEFVKTVHLDVTGKTRFLELDVTILPLKSGMYWLLRIVDITLKNAEKQALERNRQSFKSILENTPEGILIIHQNELLYTNKGMHGIIEREVTTIDDLFIPIDQQQFLTIVEEQRKHKTIYQQQLRLKTSSKNELTVDVTLVSTLFENKESTLVIIKDISLQHQLSREMLRAEIAEETNKKLATEIKERIRTEKLLQEQFLRSNAIFDSSSNTLLLTLDTDFKISSFNTHCQNYFSYLIDKKMEVNDSFNYFFNQVYDAKQIRYFRFILNAVKKGESKQMESYFNSKGSVRWIELFINPIVDIEGQVTEISLVGHDITEKKLSEKEIVESLKEKEVLLKEIHHRVKNNLQVISSILNLQSSFVKDEKTLEILDESRNRIRSMAIIHENLYRTTNFSSIDFTSYLQNLCTNLISSYHVYSGIVEFKDEMEKIDLVLDQAIPCGLLVNELITNSIKYAFPSKQEGQITVGLEEKDETIYLRIEDNGIGLPKDFDMMKTDTLGLQLVSTLVEQLDGEIKVRNHQGTKYLITFGKVKL
ncbi:MAG: putative sensor histidine kinase pdtaS [Bacteroidota bacterium]|jgi:PAS domain S-box-containing protein